MLLKTSFLLPYLFCNVEFDFTWFHNNQTVVKDFNSQNRNAWVSRSEEYWNYWVLINAFWIRLDLSDIDMWDVDLSDTDLDLLDKDIPSKHYVGLQDVFKTCLQNVFKSCLQDVLKTSSKRLQDVFARRIQDILEDEKLLRWRRFEDVFETSARPTNVCWAISLPPLFASQCTYCI